MFTFSFYLSSSRTQNIESVFDIMDMEDEERNKLLQLTDAQMQVKIFFFHFVGHFVFFCYRTMCPHCIIKMPNKSA